MKTILAAVTLVSGLALASASYAQVQELHQVFNGQIGKFHTGTAVVCAEINGQWYWATSGTSQALEMQLYYHFGQTIPFFQGDSNALFTCHRQGENAVAWQFLDVD